MQSAVLGHMETPEVIALNKRLGDLLGRNPHNEPLYRWLYSETFMHWMKDIGGYKEVIQPSGIITMEPIYIERKMCPSLIKTWVIGHWHDAGSESEWLALYGTKGLWPRKGYYTPTNAWGERGQLPTHGLTDKLIEIVRMQRAKTAADIRAEGLRLVESEEKADRNERADIIGDAMTPFMSVPGVRGGHVSFPMPGVDYQTPALAGTQDNK